MTEKFPFSLPAMEIVLAMGPEFFFGGGVKRTLIYSLFISCYLNRADRFLSGTTAEFLQQIVKLKHTVEITLFLLYKSQALHV